MALASSDERNAAVTRLEQERRQAESELAPQSVAGPAPNAVTQLDAVRQEAVVHIQAGFRGMMV